MGKLTLKKLAEYWLDVGDYQTIIPDYERMTSRQANELGRDILNLLERIKKIESILNFQNKEIK